MGARVRLDFEGDTSDLESATDRAGSALDGLTKGISAKGAAMAAAGAGLATGLAAAFTNSLDMEGAQAKFAAQLGGSSDYAAQMGGIAGHLYANAYGENLGEVNDALKAVLQNGLLPEDAADADIERVTGKVMSLASAFDQDVGGSVNAVSQMIKTGLAGNADEAMDILTRGFQQGNDKAGDLLDTMNEYGTQFRKVGLDGTTAMGLISQGLKGGARDADLVADAIKEFSIRAIDGSKTSAEGYAALGLSAEGMTAQIAKGGDAAKQGLDTVLDRLNAITDPVQKNAAGVALFGTQWEDMGAAVNGLNLDTAAAQMGNVAGAAAKVDETLGQTAGAKLESVKRGFEEWTNSIVGVQGPLGTVAASVMTFGGDAIGIVGSLGMAGMALQSFGVFSKLAAAGQWLLNAALSANPIGIVVLAIAALVAGLIWAYNNVGWFKDGVDAAFGFVVDVVGGAVDWIVGAWDSLVSFFTGAPAAVGGVVDQVGAWFASLPGIVGDGLAAAGTAVLDFLAALPGYFLFGLGFVLGLIWVFWTETVPTAVGAGLDLLTELIMTGAAAAWDFLWNTLPGVLEQVMTWLFSLPGMALDAMSQFGAWLGEVSAQAWDLFLQWAITKTAELMAWVSTIPGAVGGFLASLPGIVGQAALDAWNGFLTWTVSTGQGALDWIAGVPGSIGNFFSGAGDWLVNAGRMILEGLWNGLKSVAQGVLDWISNIGAQIANGFAAAVGIHSPSTVFAEFGVNIGEGLIVGGEKVEPRVLDSYSGLSAAVVSSMDGVTAQAVGAGGGGTAAGNGASVTFAGNTSDALATVIMMLIRTGKIQIKAA